MLAVLQKERRDFGRPPKLGRGDQLLITLVYWREFRTEFRVGISYGVSESTVCRTIQRVENVLMKSGEFRLLGKKALQPSDTLIEMVLIDAPEEPIDCATSFYFSLLSTPFSLFRDYLTVLSSRFLELHTLPQ